MTRPLIVRADTIDLQHHHAPSTQDHPADRAHRPSRNPFSSPPVLLAPHQAETLRDVAHETSRDHARSPWAATDTDNGRPTSTSTADGMDVYQQHQHQQDSLAAAHNGNAADDDDIEDDGDLDDDMMDRISSSPSIEDGACSSAVTPVAWPRRVSSLSSIPRTPWTSLHLHASPHSPSPTPAPSTPDTDFLHQIRIAQDHHHLLAGEYVDCSDIDDENRDTDPGEDETERRNLAVDEVDGAFIQDPASHRVGTVDDETHEAECDCDYDCDRGCDNSQDLCAHQNEADPDPDPDSDADLPLTIPYNKSFEEDDDSDFSLPDDPRFIDYGWAAECLHEPEDIDFEFVYALHTFVATVEGQANATKGDTMVLLDDSNSYWWLVRVVKDSSIGYLPAEHIETPTERLARLNKHRNIDLSASMLTDQQQPPKQKSGFSIGIKKKATVAFADPTYFDYSDHDYSSEEEDADEASEATQQKKQATPADDEDTTDESARVEPLKTNKSKTAAKPADKTQDDSSDDEDLRGSLDIVEKRDGPSISRNGNIRNTDSFFKDETAETKKITLTPNLLRDDGPRESTDSMSSGKPRTSLDRFEKELMSDKDRKKSKEKDKGGKDKKPGGLRGFFSRKDKKQSPDDRPEGESRDSEERHSEEQHSSPEKAARQPAKLHKQQARLEPTVNNKAPQASTVELASYLAESRINDVSNVPPPSMRIVNPETNETQEVPSHQPPRGRPSLEKEAPSPTTRRGAEVATSPRSATAPRALNHLDLSDSDESDDGDAILDQMPQPNSSTPIKATKAPQDDEVEEPIIPGSFPESNASAAADKTPVPQPAPLKPGARSHSVSPVSPVASSEPPALMVDTSSPDDRSPSASPSPELTQSAEDRSKSSSSSTGSKEQTWDDMKLRAFFDEPDHIRDLLVVVYDKTDVVPASSDHPVVGGLFREQNAKLAEITTQLDNMLGDWLARKQRTRGGSR
ncbi:hypothetical protein BBK36DRAFT_1160374 [Trichoderma citrinoviride]|uniref:SH3 domain-containing protein n=1 Tax=Trichoderma citrinoviride TaxID=58853 RepID=A0A2T4B766_9HYPO|nr:hypothetical protein BBK36DRAFT_1160374 [Trichoderma citrinoviride]PTB65165.1 hypothetical protein BBK36DRAFT_1160374 [Trichoderma citrinoviride]